MSLKRSLSLSSIPCLGSTNFQKLVFSSLKAILKPFVACIIIRSSAIWVLVFSAPEPQLSDSVVEFTKAAEHLKGEIRFGAVNCAEQQALCAHFLKANDKDKVSLPTVLLFKSDLERVVEQGESQGMTKNPVLFTDTFKASRIAHWALSFLDTAALKVDSDKSLESFTQLDLGHFGIFFSDKPKVPRLVKVLAQSLKIHVANKHILPFSIIGPEYAKQRFGDAIKFPSLAVLKKDKTLIHYDGELTLDKMLEFLKPYGSSLKEVEEASQAAYDRNQGKKQKAKKPEKNKTCST